MESWFDADFLATVMFGAKKMMHVHGLCTDHWNKEGNNESCHAQALSTTSPSGAAVVNCKEGLWCTIQSIQIVTIYNWQHCICADASPHAAWQVPACAVPFLCALPVTYGRRFIADLMPMWSKHIKAYACMPKDASHNKSRLCPQSCAIVYATTSLCWISRVLMQQSMPQHSLVKVYITSVPQIWRLDNSSLSGV